MIIRQYTESDKTLWNSLLENSPNRRLSHELGYSDWITEIYGYTPLNLVAENKKGPVAIFPAFIWRQWGRRPQLLSVPFFEYGGPIFKTDNNELRKEFMTTLANWIESNGYEAARFLGPYISCEAINNLPWVHSFDITNIGVLRLKEPDELWKDVKYSVRKNINKAKRSGLSVSEDHSINAFRQDFYPLYLKNMHKFGTPPHPFAYYESLIKHLASATRLWIARLEGRPIACLLGFSTGIATHIVSTVSSKDYLDLRPNDLLHWEAIISSVKEGKKMFDFGLMRYKGQIDYKEKWGIDKIPYYEVVLSKSGQNIISIFRDVKLHALLWRSLVPTRITAYLGKPIRRIFVR